MGSEISPRCYDSCSVLSVLKMMKQVLCARTKLRRLACLNRLHDYLGISEKKWGGKSLLPLHRELSAILIEQAKTWRTYDYGEGYFYQGSAELGITGFRDTEARFAFMDLENRLRGKSVLDIGCNAGFLTLRCAKTASEIIAMEINPFLVRVATASAEFLGRKNAVFLAGAFEDFQSDRAFDVVLSFANHSTYDHNTRQSTAEYFDKCRRLLNADGLFLFESHAPDYEGDRLVPVIGLIEERFVVVERKTMDGGSFLDKGRVFLVARPKRYNESARIQ